jgi:uncharacterized YigZ family protein
MTLQKITSEDEYLVPASDAVAEIKIKGSRFIATIRYVADTNEAESALNSFRKTYYNATHNCFAYRINARTFRYSDDGEPSGTAGKPIMQVLDSSGILHILCVVTRYYGGTKLGTGGLIRAYSQAAELALAGLETKTVVRMQRLELRFTYEQENLVRKAVSDFAGRILNSAYSASVTMEVAVPNSRQADFCTYLIDHSNSQITIHKP